MGYFEDNRRFRIILAVCGLLAVVFQFISLFTKKWIALFIEDQYISFGVFSTESDVSEVIITDEDSRWFTEAVVRDIRVAAALTTLAAVASVLGLICMGLVYLTDVYLKARQRRLVSCVCWIISGVFQLVAIVCTSQFIYFLGNVICGKSNDCEVLFPWSIYASGFGLLFTVISAAMTNLLMCFEQPIRRTSNVEMC